MIQHALFVVTLLSALGCGLVAGVFFAFSGFVMKALGRLPPEQGIAAMQSINVVVINPLFLLVFVGSAAGGALLAVWAPFRWHEPGSPYLVLGGVLYVVGTFLVTRLFNIPRNDALAAVDARSAEGAARWADYLASWTAWNHVRAAAALLAAAALIMALVRMR
jgi:uncharacterized membrane protein